MNEEIARIRVSLRIIEAAASTLRGEVPIITERFATRSPKMRNEAALYRIKVAFTRIHREGAEAFKRISTEFDMSPAERKQMELAARYFNVRSKRFTATEKDDPSVLMTETASTLEEWVATGRTILDRGVACQDVCTTACFRTVNAGGFSAKIMDVARSVAEDAAKRVNAIGFDNLCYGDVVVTNTILGDSKVLAFYVGAEDRMYIRANLRKSDIAEAIGTVIHELGHRLDRKALSQSQKNAFTKLYFEWKRQKEEGVRNSRSELPAVGTEIVDSKGQKWRVTGIEYGKRGSDKFVTVENANGGPGRGRINEKGWHHHFGGGLKSPFPTPYAETNEHEMIAELFRFYVLGTLSPEQRGTFEQILGRGLARGSRRRRRAA